MATDWRGVLKSVEENRRDYAPKYFRASGDDSGDIGHASWKNEELQQQYQENNPQYLQAMAQQQYYEDQIRLKQEAIDQAKRKQEKEDYETWQRNQLLNSVADSRYQDKLASGEISSSQMLSDQAKRAAAEAQRRGLSGYANDFLSIASKYEQQAQQYRARQETLNDKKLDDVRETLRTVNDPVSWAYAKPELAKVGIDVPQQFQSWGPDTAKWVDMQARMSKSVQAAQRLDNSERTIADTEKYRQDKLLADQQKAQQKRIDEAFKQQLITANRPLSGQGLEGTMASFQGDEGYKGLEVSDQVAAAQELPAVTQYYITQGYDGATAKTKAREDILGRIQEGKFTPFTSKQEQKVESTSIAKPTSQADFDALPKGSKFINPADGKTYIKN